jgi:WD40 repeat protein
MVDVPHRLTGILCSGHIAEITSSTWHPSDPNIFLTSSADSTIRIWDVNHRAKSKSVIVVKSKQPGQRTRISAASYSRDGRTIAGAGHDGSLHLWSSSSSSFIRPNASVDKAHEKGTATSGIVWSLDNHTIVTRGGDGTVKGAILAL